MKGPIREIAKVPNGFYKMDISPDAKQLAWAISEYGKVNVIEILDIDSGTKKRVSIPSIQDLTGLDWMADMSGFLSGEPLITGANRIIFIDMRGNVRVLYDAKNLQSHWAVASPNGTKVAILGYTLEANVWTMENF